MTWNIDKAQAQHRAIRRLSIKGCKDEVDRDAAPLLLRQTIRVDTSQRTNKCRFSVINMTRGPDNYRPGLTRRICTRIQTHQILTACLRRPLRDAAGK